MRTDSINHWDIVAENYSEENHQGKNFHAQIYLAAVNELLGDVAGKHVLDAGCGDGFFSLELARKGALVTAIDGSDAMLNIAKRRHFHGNLQYNKMDLTGELTFENKLFDIVVANMLLMDIPEIELFIFEVARVLKRPGDFIFSITHPCFFLSDWEEDENNTKRYKKIVNYLDEGVEELNFWGKTLHYHRPLSSYMAALEKTGMYVSSFREPIPPRELIELYPEQEYHYRIPSFVVIKAKSI
ncbi:class I SAM-dependent methyltransferase [Methanosarcina sp. T3]|uniref:class I SAM-dependent methyltransferase n=1 Tax=Methanosarcina sp. T3 TaxID=3439062 RepID=UPI003F87B089